MVNFLTLAAQVPPVGGEVPPNTTWVGVVLAFIVLLTPLVSAVIILMKGWNDRRNQSLKSELDTLKATHDESLRKEKLAAEAIIAAPPTIVTLAAVPIPDDLRVLYIGENEADQMMISNIFRDVGIENRLVMVDSLTSGFNDLKQHPKNTLVILYVIDPNKGFRFMDLINEDNTTQDTPVVFIDGNSEKGKLDAFKNGAIGFIEMPLDIAVFLSILSRHGFNTNLEKNK